eukprot:scaffold1351_cov176-Amphora_coffeaeformis.AAC.19
MVHLYSHIQHSSAGVLHNGVAALDGAIECVEQLYKAGKKLIILSNTSAPSDKALLKLPKLGFNSEHISSGAVTSGEEASKYILETYGSDPSVTKKALMLTWDTTDLNNPRLTALPEQFLEQCGNIDVAQSVQDADFLLLHGSEVWYRGPKLEPFSLLPFITHGSLESVNPLLEECSKRNLPMVCANPDNIVRTPEGGDAHMPGKLAARYTQLVDPNDVDCRIFGKPHVEHFRACLKRLQQDHGIAADRVAHVGDSLHHDIAGASSAGIASVWTTSSGIHANDLGLKFGQQPTAQQVRDLLKKEGTAEPTHILPARIDERFLKSIDRRPSTTYY